MCILSKHQQNVLQTPWGSTHSLSRLPLRRPINTKEHSDFLKNGSLLSWFKPPDTIFRESTSSTKRLPPKKGEQFSQTTLEASEEMRICTFMLSPSTREFLKGTKVVYFKNSEKRKCSDLKMVICYQNCSDLLWEKKSPEIFKFSAVSLEFQKFLSMTRTIFSHSRSEQFW